MRINIALLGVLAFVTAAPTSPVNTNQPARARSASNSKAAPRIFRVWVFSDAHVGQDLRGPLFPGMTGAPRQSLATALRQSEGPRGFDWDIALDLGDLSGAQGTPQDEEGQEIVSQFAV